jgi:hypothetical protein
MHHARTHVPLTRRYSPFSRQTYFVGAVDLVTLLFCSENHAEHHAEIDTVWWESCFAPTHTHTPSLPHSHSLLCSARINTQVAKQGGIAKIKDYWEVSSFFEVNVVSQSYSLANQAAPVMFSLAVSSDMLETTMRNIMLVDRLRKQRESMASGATLDDTVSLLRSNPARSEFEFWCEFFINASRLQEDLASVVRLPVLLQTTGACSEGARANPPSVVKHPHPPHPHSPRHEEGCTRCSASRYRAGPCHRGGDGL